MLNQKLTEQHTKYSTVAVTNWAHNCKFSSSMLSYGFPSPGAARKAISVI